MTLAVDAGVMNETHKRCTACGELKPRSKFYVFHAMDDGLTPWCKSCRNGCTKLNRQQQEWYAGPQWGDPSEERIAFLCGEIRKRWTPAKRRAAIERARRVVTSPSR